MKIQRFTVAIPETFALTIAKCADQTAGFPSYSMPCLMAIFNAQTQMLNTAEAQIKNHCEHYTLEVTKKVVRFECTDNPGSFSMCAVVDCEFIKAGNKQFLVYWRDGKLERMEGKTIQEAFTNAGLSAGAVSAVDFYDEAVEQTHTFIEGEWVNNLDLKEKVGG